MNDCWYPITAHHPAPFVQVRGIVEVRCRNPFDAHLIISRGKPPHSDKWAEWTKAKATPLPAGVTPKYWQPQHPDKWGAPLPPAASVSHTGLMWSATQRFQAVDEAEAAELARDMERDREMARYGAGDIYEGAHKQGLPWWRDASLIRYAPKGAITQRMAEGRVMRAVALCGYGKGLTIRVSTFSDILARMTKTEMGELDFSDYVPHLKGLPQDHEDFLTAMMWFTALNPDAARPVDAWTFNRPQLLLHYRSLNVPLSFAEIGALKEFKLESESVRKLYGSTLRRITALANGVIVAPACGVLELLRERNRLAKREAAA